MVAADGMTAGQPPGVVSQRLLADLQARALRVDAEVAVLVEGISDYFAIETLAERTGSDLAAAGVVVVPMGGATNLGHFLAHFGPRGLNVRIAGLCDVAEAEFVRRTLQRADALGHSGHGAMAEAGFFICERDLEDELIRALGAEAVERVIEGEGELDSLRRLQRMPFHRDRATEDQLHRFIGVRSGRKYRYAPLLVEAALDDDVVPRPLRHILSYALTHR